MPDLSRGTTFTTGIPDAASLHNLVDAGTVLPAFILSKPTATPGDGDQFVFVSGGAYKRCSLRTLVAAFPNGGSPSTFALRRLGTTAQAAAAGNDSRFPATLPAGSIRVAQGTSADTAATPSDLTFPVYSLIGKTEIDWSKSNVFFDTLTANGKTYSFSHLANGRSIQVIINLAGHTIPTMPGLFATVGASTPAYLHYFLTYTSGLAAVSGLLVKI